MKLKNLILTTLFFWIFFFNIGFAKSAPDTILIEQVKYKISSDNSLQGTSIRTTAHNGIVFLSGNVGSAMQASTAAELAQSTPGVRNVDASRLQIKNSSQPITDALITAKIKGMFLQQRIFGVADIAAMAINVETNNGIVSLSGTIDNQKQLDNAVQIVKSVTGVKNIKLNIKIVTIN